VDNVGAAPPKIHEHATKILAKAAGTWSHPSFGGGRKLSPASQDIRSRKPLPDIRRRCGLSCKLLMPRYLQHSTGETVKMLTVRENGVPIKIADPQRLS